MTKFVLFTLVLFSVGAQAQISGEMRLKIRDGCIANATRVPRNLLQICTCIANQHYRGALNEPDPAQGFLDLRWAVSFYNATTEGRRRQIERANPVLAEYDGEIAAGCAGQ